MNAARHNYTLLSSNEARYAAKQGHPVSHQDMSAENFRATVYCTEDEIRRLIEEMAAVDKA